MKSNGSESNNPSSSATACEKDGVLAPTKNCKLHEFSSDEITRLRSDLLRWFNANKRDLPWRRLAVEEKDRNRRGYAVWVSEVMLQQTQVATVVDYYEKWMKRWPTMEELSRATLEEVNEMWAGLGYYSRARRLYEGCKKVVNKMDGEMPADAASLIKHLPGVGRYTAGAIASIAFGEQTGVVDGNVVRVLSRLRIIGQDSTTTTATAAFWNLAKDLLDDQNPGDFNQAMMELGATVCTPKTPQCKQCPVQAACHAYKQVKEVSKNNSLALKSFFKADNKTNENSSEAKDIEDVVSNKCELCFPHDGTWNSEIGVCNYPRKQKLKAAREERVAVCILEYPGDKTSSSEAQLFICKRPSDGLLAGLWEFPNVILEEEWSDKKATDELLSFLKKEFKITLSDAEKPVPLGEVRHIFSHIHHTYVVQKVVLGKKLPPLSGGKSTTGRGTKWVTTSEFLEAAVSTNMKKVFNLYKSGQNKKGIKRKKESKDESRKQRVLESFFVRK